MDLDAAREFCRHAHHAVLVTHRRDGGLQTSPVAAVTDADGLIVVSTPGSSAKAANLRREPRASLCAVSDGWFGPWVHLDVTAAVVEQPASLPLLEDYYRRIAGDHPDWAEYRAAMVREQRVLLRLTPVRAAGPV